MATDTLRAADMPAKSAGLDQMATTIQSQAHRITSLAEAIDHETDGQPDAAALGRVLDYLNLLREAAEKARAAGEQLEIYAMEANRKESKQ